MTKPDQTGKPDSGPKGQDKEHAVTYPDGTAGTMTQREWKDRDKGAGIVRPDDAPEIEDVPTEPDPIPAPIS